MTWNVTYGFYLVAKLLYKMHASLRSGDVRCFVNLKYSFAIFCLYRIFWTRIRFFWFRRLTGVAMKANAIFSIFSTTICKILGPAIEDCWFDRPEKNKNHVDNHRLIQVVRISLIIHSSTFQKFKKKQEWTGWLIMLDGFHPTSCSTVAAFWEKPDHSVIRIIFVLEVS